MAEDNPADRRPLAFNILIVGAGIGGLGAAIALARKGFPVRVLEEKNGLNEFGASINVLASATKILKAWGLEKDFEPVVDLLNWSEIRNGTNNESIGKLVSNAGNRAEILYGAPFWSIHRADLQQVLGKAAEAHGAKLIFNASVVAVDSDNCRVTLQDGREFSADLIVGADGISSAIRRSLPALSSIEPIPFFEKVWRCTVPKSTMRDNPRLNWLLDPSQKGQTAWVLPGKYVLGAPLPPHQPFDMVFGIVGAPDVPAGQWGMTADPVEMSKNFTEFCPEVKELLSLVNRCVKWTLGEMPPLPTCRSENGRVVLTGDAWHAMIPHSASGGTSAIEDAAVLAECVQWTFDSGHDIARATQVYEELRKPRVERMQRASQESARNLLTAEGEAAEVRDRVLGERTKAIEEELLLPEEERRAKPKPKADMDAQFPSPPYMQWLYAFDIVADAREYLGKLS